MLCVSIAQRSHRFAFVDMYNASSLCDLIEIRLDRFEKPPDVKTLLESCPKSAIVSCRRPDDGGHWRSSEAARLALLRQAVLEGADYVELEKDCAHQVRRYGQTKRVIAYTNIRRVPPNLDEIHLQMTELDPDVIKITVPTRTPEEAWPVIRLMAKAKIPTVAVGLGEQGRMLSVLSRRYGAPWTYTALERGMEAYPGNVSIGELQDVYNYSQLEPTTPMMAVTGTALEQEVAARVLNHGFRLGGVPTRCLPLAMGNVELFRKIVDAIKLSGVMVDEEHQETIREVLTEQTERVERAKATDFVAILGKKWLGFNALGRAVPEAILHRIQATSRQALENQQFLVIGAGPVAGSVATGLKKHGARLVITHPDEQAGNSLAGRVDGLYLTPHQLDSADCDGILVCERGPERRPGTSVVEVPESLIGPDRLGMDLTNMPFPTDFLRSLVRAGGPVVSPKDVFLRMMQTVIRIFTDKRFSVDELAQALEPFDLEIESES